MSRACEFHAARGYPAVPAIATMGEPRSWACGRCLRGVDVPANDRIERMRLRLERRREARKAYWRRRDLSRAQARRMGGAK